jgi:Flp pilus assembly protein TadG
MKRLHSGARSRQGIILSMELVLVLPIFLLLIFAVIEFSLLMSARTRVGDAARNGSRLLCVAGAPDDDIRKAVADSLGTKLSRVCSIQILPGAHPGDTGNVRIQIPMNSVSPDLLWMTGFSLRDRCIQADAPMVTERCVTAKEIQRL